MNALLYIDLPSNWTGQDTQIHRPLFTDGSTLLHHQVNKLLDLNYDILASIYVKSECKDLQVVLDILKHFDIKYDLVQDANAGQRVKSAFDKNPHWAQFQKIVCEDFFSPSKYSQEVYQNIGQEDYTFSVFETLGTNFEIFHKSIYKKLDHLDPDSPHSLQYQIAKYDHQYFERKRHFKDYTNEFITNFRFTLDSPSSFDHLHNFLKNNELDQEQFESYCEKHHLFLRSFPTQFYNHRDDFKSAFDTGIKLQYLERGFVCKKFIKQDSRVLDICSGDMLLPEMLYSKGSQNITCIDNSEHSHKVHQDLKLEQKGIQLFAHNILTDEGWDKIRQNGLFDVITFTAAIEHFTEKQQHFLAMQIEKSLNVNGVAVGDTCIWYPNSMPGHWQHKNEFYSEKQLADIFVDYFSDVEVFVSEYSDILDQPVYFICKK
ncbi:MAG: class I SAM-dependent methyltransferase [Candidatus Cloacimonetes bacterium]|nr:class I SAM-dependent methyltransferase [Candidatus Cloacimonadota bacterium]